MAGRFAIGLGLKRRGSVAAGRTPAFEELSGQLYALFGLSRLLSAYDGPCIRVRRDIDNVQRDFGFRGSGLDIEALTAFAGTGSAYVVTWYDQTGGGRAASQGTAAAQPRIVNAGSVEVDASGKVGLVFDGADDFFQISTGRGLVRNVEEVTVGTVVDLVPGADRPILTGLEAGGMTARFALRYLHASLSISISGRRQDGVGALSVVSRALSGSGTRRIIGLARYSAAEGHIAVNGATTSAVFGTAGLTDDTESYATYIGAHGGPRFAGHMRCLVLARRVLDISTLDTALARA